MKKSSVLFVAFAGAALVVIGGVMLFGNKLLASPTAASTACTTNGKTITMTIKNNVIVPAVITAHRCDMLTITNLDPLTREIGFGPHEHHEPYDGVTEKVVHQHESLTVTLVQTGTFHFHDHFHEEVNGQFTVY